MNNYVESKKISSQSLRFTNFILLSENTHSHVAKNIFFGSIGTLLNFPPQLFCTVVNYTSVRK